MRLKKIFEKKGFRDLLVKSVVFVGLLALMQVLTSPLAGMARVPREFKPFSFLQVGEAMLFVPALFVIYSRAKLYSADAYWVRISGFCR
ncbi:MAG: hypothetical protein U9Q92_06115 [archaeon]|nr:hypothetical protein [archaeon]